MLEISEQRRKELLKITETEFSFGDTPPLFAPDAKKEKPIKISKAGRPRVFLVQRVCECGNLARVKLKLKDIIYWGKLCSPCQYKKRKSLISKPKVCKLLTPSYIPSVKKYVPRRAKCTLQ